MPSSPAPPPATATPCRRRRSVNRRLGWSALLLLACLLLALSLGRYPLSPMQILHGLSALVGKDASSLPALVIDARLPRSLAAILVGAALATAGATYQTVFRNPLVSPGLIGVLSGSAFGAALSIVLGAAPGWVQWGAFGGGLLAMMAGLALAAVMGELSVLTLVLGGLISSALFASLLSLVKYLADPEDQLPAIVYWLLGSLAQCGWGELSRIGLPLLPGLLLLCSAGRLLDVLSVSDEEALSLGVPVRQLRLLLIVLATLVSALTVSVAGIIGWLGLLVPHLARLLIGASNTRLLPMSALLGACLLVLADTCARSLSAGEIPLGVVTELVGALAFALVLRRLRGALR